MFAFVFPGQGSQSVGMLEELGDAFAIVRETFEEVSDAVGVDLWTMARSGPEEALNSTVNTQPALLAAGIATWRVWLGQEGRRPDYLAGHSLGEYSALVAADAIDLLDGARLVAERGRAMQAAVDPGAGAMAAILGLEDEQVADVCRQAAQGEVVAPANLNSPGQVVIAGSTAAVERAVEAARAAGAKRAVPLAVSVPSHCELMRPAAQRLAEVLEQITIRPPSIPVVHNADVSMHPDVEAIRRALTQQLFMPVRWTETVLSLRDQGVTQLFECGPGKVLTGLVRRIDRQLAAHALSDPAAIEAAHELI